MTSLCPTDAMASLREVPQKDGDNESNGSGELSSPSSVLSGSSGTSVLLAESEKRKLLSMMGHDMMKVPSLPSRKQHRAGGMASVSSKSSGVNGDDMDGDDDE